MTRPAVLFGSLLWLVLPVGCATTAPPVAAKPAPLRPAALPLRIGVFPPDALPFADVAAALGERLERAPADGAAPRATEVVTAKISMEVAQLSLECVTPTNDCYTAVGKFLRVDRLLWGQVSADHDTAGVRVSVVLLDVGRGSPIGHAERSFAERTEALAGLQALVDEATHPRPAPATAPATAPVPMARQEESPPQEGPQ